MKAALIASAFLLHSPLAVSGEFKDEVEVVDHIVKSIYAQLAKDRGFNLLSAPDSQAASIGYVYYLTEPDCPADLVEMARSGEPLRLFLALELPEHDKLRPMPISGWTSIRLSTVAERGLAAELSASKSQWSAQLRASIDALDRTNAQILFATQRFSSVKVKRSMEAELKAQGIVEASDLGDGAAGAVAPHEELIVQKFEFDREAVKGRRAGVMIRLMQLFGARIDAGQRASRANNFKQATNSTAAFKAVTSMFSSCPSLEK